MRAALISGAIDIYPEYTGNAAFFFHQESDPVWKNSAAGYARAKELDFKANKLVWLTPAPADNSWAIALRKDFAAKNHLASLEDFAHWIRIGWPGEARRFRRIRRKPFGPAGIRERLRISARRRTIARAFGRQHDRDDESRQPTVFRA